MTTRRTVLLMGGAAAGAGVAATGAFAWFGGADDDMDRRTFPLSLTDREWQARLTAEEYAILREAGTEPSFSSPLNEEKRAGTFACAGCGQALYRSEHKFDSGTGWPSFTEAIPGAVANAEDRSLLFVRTEEHCAICGGHLGHVFDDGPPPTGRRHCINGLALDFLPA